MRRRDFIKAPAVLAAGVMASGCTPEAQVDGGPSASGSARSTFEQGAVPVELSGWTHTSSQIAEYPALTTDIQASVVVVGAGLAGSSLALHLAEQGVSVAVLEARQPGWGASGRNAGHVLPVLRDLKVFERFKDGGKRFLSLFREHHTIPFDLTKKYGFHSDAEQAGYLHATTSQRVFDSLKEKSRYWQSEQGQPVEMLGSAEMERMTGSRYYTKGVLYRDGGRVNPYLFTNGMISAAVARGARVHGDSEAVSLEPVGKQWRVKTARGSVTADRVVFCTNAYPNSIVPAFTNNFYPLTAYALSTKPLTPEVLAYVMPSRATLAQEPVDLNPMVIDGGNRIILSSLPSTSRPEDARWHFEHHVDWLRRTWPQLRETDIQLEHYWTGRVALRDIEFPGVFEVKPGVYGLMHFNAWGNVMAPLMGMIFAQHLASDTMGDLPFPIETPTPVKDQGKQSLIIRKLLIPAARMGQWMGIV